MFLFVSWRWRVAWFAVASWVGLQSRATAQVKLPLAVPGAEHPALFLRLMTRLCGELEKASVAGQARLVPSGEVLREGQVQLVEHSEVTISQAGNGNWVLAGPIAVGTRLSVAELQAESMSCSSGDNSRSVNVRALHEYVRWASCELRASAAARCQLQVKEALRTPTRIKMEQPLESLRPRRSFSLTLVYSAKKPQPPETNASNKRPGP